MLVTDRTYASCAERVARSDDFVVDLETDGLAPWKGHRACGVAVEPGDGREPMYFGLRHGGGGNLSDGPAKLLDALKPRSGRKYRGWHLRFDMTTLSYEDDGAAFLGTDVVAQDGIISALLMNENERYFSLEAISEKYLGAGAASSKIDMEKLLRERFPECRRKKELKGNLWRLSAAEAEVYACGDVTLPKRLAAKYEPAIKAWGLATIEEELNQYSLLLARMQRRGILIDRDRCTKLSAGTETRKDELLATIQAAVGDPDFNPNSSQQVVRYLGTENAQEVTLRRHAQAFGDVPQWIVDYKKLGKAQSTYYDAILDMLDADGVLHPQLNLTRDPRDRGGTRSSRLSCSQPNFQALPHADEDPNAIYKVRDLVIPRAGYKLAKADYQRAEMWMGAGYCKEPALIRAYHENLDLYVAMATTLGISRQEAKILFLALQYGIGAWKIAQMFGWPFKTLKQICTALFGREFTMSYDEHERSLDEYRKQKAVQVKEGFFELYPNIDSAMKAYAAYFETHGCLRLWTDRVIHFDPSTTPSYAAWNRLIQGAVAEMIRLAMQRLEPMLAQYDAHMVLQVHDELVFEYPTQVERPVLKLVKLVMEDFDFPLKPRVDISTGAQNYAEMAKWKEAA